MTRNLFLSLLLFFPQLPEVHAMQSGDSLPPRASTISGGGREATIQSPQNSGEDLSPLESIASLFPDSTPVVEAETAAELPEISSAPLNPFVYTAPDLNFEHLPPGEPTPAIGSPLDNAFLIKNLKAFKERVSEENNYSQRRHKVERISELIDILAGEAEGSQNDEIQGAAFDESLRILSEVPGFPETVLRDRWRTLRTRFNTLVGTPGKSDVDLLLDQLTSLASQLPKEFAQRIQELPPHLLPSSQAKEELGSNRANIPSFLQTVSKLLLPLKEAAQKLSLDIPLDRKFTEEEIQILQALEATYRTYSLTAMTLRTTIVVNLSSKLEGRKQKLLQEPISRDRLRLWIPQFESEIAKVRAKILELKTKLDPSADIPSISLWIEKGLKELDTIDQSLPQPGRSIDPVGDEERTKALSFQLARLHIAADREAIALGSRQKTVAKASEMFLKARTVLETIFSTAVQATAIPKNQQDLVKEDVDHALAQHLAELRGDVAGTWNFDTVLRSFTSKLKESIGTVSRRLEKAAQKATGEINLAPTILALKGIVGSVTIQYELKDRKIKLNPDLYEQLKYTLNTQLAAELEKIRSRKSEYFESDTSDFQEFTKKDIEAFQIYVSQMSELVARIEAARSGEPLATGFWKDDSPFYMDLLTEGKKAEISLLKAIFLFDGTHSNYVSLNIRIDNFSSELRWRRQLLRQFTPRQEDLESSKWFEEEFRKAKWTHIQEASALARDLRRLDLFSARIAESISESEGEIPNRFQSPVNRSRELLQYFEGTIREIQEKSIGVDTQNSDFSTSLLELSLDLRKLERIKKSIHKLAKSWSGFSGLQRLVPSTIEALGPLFESGIPETELKILANFDSFLNNIASTALTSYMLAYTPEMLEKNELPEFSPFETLPKADVELFLGSINRLMESAIKTERIYFSKKDSLQPYLDAHLKSFYLSYYTDLTLENVRPYPHLLRILGYNERMKNHYSYSSNRIEKAIRLSESQAYLSLQLEGLPNTFLGMRNFGLTCYLNSIFNALFFTELHRVLLPEFNLKQRASETLEEFQQRQNLQDLLAELRTGILFGRAEDRRYVADLHRRTILAMSELMFPDEVALLGGTPDEVEREKIELFNARQDASEYLQKTLSFLDANFLFSRFEEVDRFRDAVLPFKIVPNKNLGQSIRLLLEDEKEDGRISQRTPDVLILEPLRYRHENQYERDTSPVHTEDFTFLGVNYTFEAALIQVYSHDTFDTASKLAAESQAHYFTIARKQGSYLYLNDELTSSGDFSGLKSQKIGDVSIESHLLANSTVLIYKKAPILVKPREEPVRHYRPRYMEASWSDYYKY